MRPYTFLIRLSLMMTNHSVRCTQPGPGPAQQSINCQTTVNPVVGTPTVLLTPIGTPRALSAYGSHRLVGGRHLGE